ncbi:MAG: carboxypeptidase-like regulatory domain-containing protein, partial [Actinomycetota bacterium]
LIYDISGKYTDGQASLAKPIKIGYWVAPYAGPLGNDTTGGQWGNVTSHVGTFQAERFLLSIGWYTLGSWVVDLGGPTLTEGGLYDEWSGNLFGQGPTTWGNTTGNILLEGDEVWSTKWSRFDDPIYDRYMFTNGLTRGMDTLRYTGPLPQKVARLTATAGGASVSGVLDRYAVWTFTGWENRPLGGKVLQVSAGGSTVEATTADDGSFTANLALAPGTYDVTITWAGDETYRAATTTLATTIA